MNCCFTACELWKLARRGFVPMDIYNAQQRSWGCGCDDYYDEASSGCGCDDYYEASSGCGCNENNRSNRCGC